MPKNEPPRDHNEQDHWTDIPTDMVLPVDASDWVINSAVREEREGSPSPFLPADVAGAEEWCRWLAAFIDWFVNAWEALPRIGEGEVDLDRPPKWAEEACEGLTKAARAVQRHHRAWALRPPQDTDSLSHLLRRTRDFVRTGGFDAVDVDRLVLLKYHLEDAADRLGAQDGNEPETQPPEAAGHQLPPETAARVLPDAIATGLSAVSRGIDSPPPNHSPDFTSVNWFGTSYKFAIGNQASSVAVLWEAWEKGGHRVHESSIATQIGASGDHFKLCKAFRRRKPEGGYIPHPAWDTMIKSDGDGCFRLASPPTNP